MNKKKVDLVEYSLAIETSSRFGSVALGADDEVIDERTFAAGQRHAVELLGAVDAMLKDNGVRPGQLARIFVSAGPGSFTGLRVGFSFARALAHTTSARLVAVSTCEVITENLRKMLGEQGETVWIAVALDAKRNQVYAATFRWDAETSELEKILDERVIAASDLVSQLSRPLWITGEGIDYHRQQLQGERIVFVDKDYWQPKASLVCTIGIKLAKAEPQIDYNKLTPTYIRLPTAEERWRERMGKKDG